MNKVISKKMRVINRQIQCYFTCIHSFVNRKMGEESIMAGVFFFEKRFIGDIEKEDYSVCFHGYFPLKKAYPATPPFPLETVSSKKKPRSLCKIFEEKQSKILNQ